MTALKKYPVDGILGSKQVNTKDMKNLTESENIDYQTWRYLLCRFETGCGFGTGRCKTGADYTK